MIADRFSRRWIMIAHTSAIVVLDFYLSAAGSDVLVYVLTVFQLAFSSFFEPAKTAAIPSIVSIVNSCSLTRSLLSLGR